MYEHKQCRYCHLKPEYKLCGVLLSAVKSGAMLRGCALSKNAFSVSDEVKSQETWGSYGTRVIKPGLYSSALQAIPLLIGTVSKVVYGR